MATAPTHQKSKNNFFILLIILDNWMEIKDPTKMQKIGMLWYDF
jgi:hypothetical protein